MNNPPKNNTPDKALVERARKAAATIFDRIARKSRNTDVADLNRHYAKKIRAGEGDDFDAVQSALLALSQPQHGGLVEALSTELSDVEAEAALTGESIYVWGPEGEKFARMFAAAMKVRAALASNSPVVGEDRPRWRWGYTDGVPGTPEYEPAPQICNWCNTVRSRSQCDAKPTPTDTADHPIARVAVMDVAIGTSARPGTENGGYPDVAADRREAIALVLRNFRFTARGTGDREQCIPLKHIPRLTDAIASLIAVTDGMCIVPREPSEAMLSAWANSDKFDYDWRADCRSGWSAMIAAATGAA